MSRVDFNITDRMINLINVYEDLKSKHFKKSGIDEYNKEQIKSFVEKDTYIKTITTNLFNELSKEVPNHLYNGRSIDYNQVKWIKDLVLGRNAYAKTTLDRKTGKKLLIFTRMEQPHTIQGKDAAPEMNPFLDAKKDIEGRETVFDTTGVAAALEAKTKNKIPLELTKNLAADSANSKQAKSVLEFARARRERLSQLTKQFKGN